MIPSRPLKFGQMMGDKKKEELDRGNLAAAFEVRIAKAWRDLQNVHLLKRLFPLRVCCPHVFAWLPLSHCLSRYIWDSAETDVV